MVEGRKRWVGAAPRVGVVVAVAASVAFGSVPRHAAGALQSNELDAFMERVLERRVTNWEDLYRYTVRDRESFEVVGPGGTRLGSYHGEFTWYVRDGFMIRSPDRVDGRAVGDAERESFEQGFLERARARAERRSEARQARAEETGDPAALEREYFLGFPFEPGNYLLAGRETLDGLDVVRVEYYPEKLFEDEDEDEDEDRNGVGERDSDGEDGSEEDRQAREWARRFSKTSVVTLWILPEAHQIVRVEYDSIGMGFLPLRWLLQVDDVGASMTLHKPFADRDVWLPRQIQAGGRATVANGTYAFEYRLEYHDYREAEVGARVRFRIPGIERRP